MASIPLPALAVNTQQQSPLAMYAQLQQIRNAQQQQQTAGLEQTRLSQENQQRELQLKDQTTLRALATNHVTKDDKGNVTGFDAEGFFNEALEKQVNPNTINQLRMQYATTTKDLAAASETVRKNEKEKNQASYELLEGARSEPDVAKRAAIVQAGLPNLQKLGVDTSKLAQIQNFDDNSLTAFEAGIGMHAQQLADAKTAADTAKTLADKAKTEMETKLGGSPETRSMNDWLAKNPGKGPSDYEEHMKKLVPAFNFNLSGGATGGLSQAAIDQQAEKYYQTGQLPPSGRGAAGVALGRTIMQRASELHPGASLAEGSAEFAANKESLKKLQSNLDAVSAFEKTANKNLDLFTSLAKKAIDTGVPLLNAPLRTGAKLLAGSEDQLAMDAARQVAVNEIAKVTSSPGLTGQLSDTARKEIAAFIPESATYGQALKVAEVLKKDMANRHQSYQEQIDDIKKRFGGKKEESSTPGKKVLSPAEWLEQQKKKE